MIQLVVINANLAKRKVAKGIRKTEAEDHEVQAVGDISDVFPSDHIFSGTEKHIFDIIKIPGYTVAEFKSKMRIRKVCEIFKSSAESNKWAFLEDIITAEAWKSKTDGKWRLLDRSVKHPLSISTLTEQDIEDLKSKTVPVVEKDTILLKLENRYKDYPNNMSEIPELSL